MKKQITFDNLPESISELIFKVDQLLLIQSAPQDEPDKLMTLQEIINYLPEKPARQTVYGWVNDRKIPFEKHGKFLYFRKSTINNWLNNGRHA